MWVRLLCFTCLFQFLPYQATAKVYRCEGAGGTTILTDQPKGKRGCELVPTASPSPPGGYTPPLDPIAPVPLDLPPATIPSSAAQAVPQQPIAGQPSTAPAAAQEPAAPSAPEAQHCSPRVNPLNPFAAMNCLPATGDKPKPDSRD